MSDQIGEIDAELDKLAIAAAGGAFFAHDATRLTFRDDMRAALNAIDPRIAQMTVWQVRAALDEWDAINALVEENRT